MLYMLITVHYFLPNILFIINYNLWTLYWELGHRGGREGVKKGQ